MSLTILQGDCRETLKTLPDASVHCCVTSPPYFGLRDYGCDGQMGLEATPDEFIAGMVGVFREVRRVLRTDATCWINIGDSYAGGGNGGGGSFAQDGIRCALPGTDKNRATRHGKRGAVDGIKPKDMIGIPWMLAFALRADGWYLRQDVIWSKPNPMPESVTDRCTKAHEYIFLLSKAPCYYFDADAIAEVLAPASINRLSQPSIEMQAGSERVPGKTNGAMKAVSKYRRGDGETNPSHRTKDGITGEDNLQSALARSVERGTRNKRSVWTVATQPFSEAHFATFPPALIRPCIRAGCPVGGTVLDPFGGSGTTGMVAIEEGRQAIICELNPDYIEIAKRRCNVTPGFAFASA